MAGVAPPLQLQQYVAAPDPGQPPQLLGAGQYPVYLYLDPQQNILVAIKRIGLLVEDQNRAAGLDRDLERELRIHYKLNHPLVVKMLDVFISADNYLNIVLEYVQDGTLFNLINSTAAPNEALVRWFFQQLICTLDYLHAKGVVHRDIKLENSLCRCMQPEGVVRQLPPDGSWLLKVADFGLSRTGEAADTDVGTSQYKAPEVYRFGNNAQNGQHNPNNPPGYAPAPVDVWSAGVLLYASLNRTYPFATGNIRNAQDVDTYLRGPRPLRYPQQLSYHCTDLIERMLAPHAADRITIPEIMAHEFFTQDIALQDPNLQQLKQLCLNLPSPCALSQQQLEGVIAQVHALLAPQAAHA